MKPIQAAIVGAGLMGRWHAHAIQKTGGGIVAIVDSNLGSAQRLAKKYNSAECFTDLEQMLQERKPDILHVCTPTSTHLSIAEHAINAGVNLIIEKPLTETASETETLLNLAKERGVFICPVHQFPFQDGALKAKKCLSRIGRIVHIEANIFSAGANGKASEHFDEIPGDILPHPLSLFQTFLVDGLPNENWITRRPAAGEIRVLGQSGNTTLSINISMNARPTACCFQIFGTKGSIYLDLFHGYSFMLPGAVSPVRKILHPFDLALRRFFNATVNLARRTICWQPAYPGLQRLIKDFYQAVRSETDSPISSEETIAVAKLRDALMTLVSNDHIPNFEQS